MKLQKALRSRVARRVFVLFVLCALVPIVGLATVSLLQVRKQLTEQSHQRLYDNSKGKALGVFERLSFVDSELSILANELIRAEEVTTQTIVDRCRTLIVMSDGDPPRWLLGNSTIDLELSPEELRHLTTGKALLRDEDGAEAQKPGVWMIRPVGTDTTRLLVSELDPSYLWALDDLPSLTELSVLNESGRVVFSSMPAPPLLGLNVIRPERYFEFTTDSGAVYVASSWQLPLKYVFANPSWTIVLSEPKAQLFASVSEFMKAYPLVVLLSFWVVLLVSMGQIRRSLDPLEKLKDGTERIARGDFETTVDVTSNDEFEELAGSFNGMARTLGRQFQTLSAMSDVDRAVLSTLEAEGIVETMLGRLHEVLTADRMAIARFETMSADDATVSVVERRAINEVERRHITLPEEIRKKLVGVSDGIGPEALSAPLPEALTGNASELEASFVLPVVTKGTLAAILALGYRIRSRLTEEERHQARRLADRLAVALGNAHLLEELEQLNWGAMVALARAIDAKSPWTAGHSERAADMAVKIAAKMGLSSAEQDIVHRGGLLHDIGKIGIPPSILDKKGKLTDEERSTMKEHPVLGARILEPIEAYAKFIPVVLQHHEWWDGSGYPDRLAGENISLYARIYAVADVYDALFADRPYREGLRREKVVDYIRERAGTQFDPSVVEAFLDLVRSEGDALDDRSRHLHRLSLQRP